MEIIGEGHWHTVFKKNPSTVIKVPKQRKDYHERVKILALLRTYFGPFIPETEIIEDSEKWYIIEQKFISGWEFLQQENFQRFNSEVVEILAKKELMKIEKNKSYEFIGLQWVIYMLERMLLIEDILTKVARVLWDNAKWPTTCTVFHFSNIQIEWNKVYLPDIWILPLETEHGKDLEDINNYAFRTLII